MGKLKNPFKRKKFNSSEKKILKELLTPIPHPESVTEEQLSNVFIERAKDEYQTHLNDIVAQLSRNILNYGYAMQDFNYSNRASNSMEQTACNNLLKTLKIIEQNDSTTKTITSAFTTSLMEFHSKLRPIITC